MHKILLADPDQELIGQILGAPGHEAYLFEKALNGEEVFDKLEQFQPDLLYIDLLLPKMHGIEVIKKIRAHPKSKDLGIILASKSSMIQNFHAAMEEGIDFFLKKPFEIAYFYSLIHRFFESGLTPAPFHPETEPPSNEIQTYDPHKEKGEAYLKFWGTRGSNPVAGPEYIRFGGNTVCLEARHGDDLVIIDAGTGIRPLGDTLLSQKEKTLHIFLSHTHWDHVTGFPFFAPLYDPDAHLVIWSPVGFEKSTKELFTEMLAYSYFPVRLEDMKAKLSFKDLRDGHPVSIGNITVDTHYAFHPGATLCFKIHINGKTVGYATDNEMFLGYHGNPNSVSQESSMVKDHQSIIEFFSGCDTLIHEAQYTPLEYQRRVGWGHSSISNATLLCKFAKIKDWIVTHHDPKHTDEDLLEHLQLHKEILHDCNISCQVDLAFDQLKLFI